MYVWGETILKGPGGMGPKPARAPGSRDLGLAKGREELYLSGVYMYKSILLCFLGLVFGE